MVCARNVDRKKVPKCDGGGGGCGPAWGSLRPKNPGLG